MRRATTRADPGPVTVQLFLSYADEDTEAAEEVRNRLVRERSNISIYSFRNGNRIDGDISNRQLEEAIRRSDAFLALLSPDFLVSPECIRERDAALHWEHQRQVNGDRSAFVRVLQVREMSCAQSGVFPDRPWLNLDNPRSLRTALAGLAPLAGNGSHADAAQNGPRAGGAHDSDAAGGSSQGNGTAGSAGPAGPVDEQGFRNRRTELNQILTDGLAKADGEHFWLVIAPPQMGKTWLLRKIGDNVRSLAGGRWVVRSIDLRDWPDGNPPGAEDLIGELFGAVASPAGGPLTAEHLAKLADDLIKTGKFHLRLLDSAELLDDGTAATLRSYLAQIHAEVEAAGSDRMRLALIVASRREPEWRGITPPPRLRTLPLSEFGDDVVREELSDRASRARRPLSRAEIRSHAALIHKVSEGLPALLVEYLNWIEAGRWTALPQLASRDVFDNVARPYVNEVLLSSASLLGHYGHLPDDQRTVIEAALRALMPYRLLTQSHLSHHADAGSALRTSMAAVGWPVEQVWAAVGNTALLFRPQEDPWYRIDGPIRRLLVRYWYPDAAQRRQAHQEAGSFMRRLAAEPSGRDQAYLLVECLWHEAKALAGQNANVIRNSLVQLAGSLSVGLRGSLAVSAESLRECAVERLAEDLELADELRSVDGWHGAVRQAILSSG